MLKTQWLREHHYVEEEIWPRSSEKGQQSNIVIYSKVYAKCTLQRNLEAIRYEIGHFKNYVYNKKLTQGIKAIQNLVAST